MQVRGSASIYHRGVKEKKLPLRHLVVSQRTTIGTSERKRWVQTPDLLPVLLQYVSNAAWRLGSAPGERWMSPSCHYSCSATAGNRSDATVSIHDTSLYYYNLYKHCHQATKCKNARWQFSGRIPLCYPGMMSESKIKGHVATFLFKNMNAFVEK